MAFIRQYIIPLLIVLIFGVALLAVSARIFLPSDMAAPAPIEEVESAPETATGLPQDKEPILPTSGASLAPEVTK